jgi:putative two-component system response regulator
MNAPPELPADEPATILVIDDVPDNLLVVSDLLREAGYRVRAATSGAIGLRYARSLPQPDLVLLDISMPEMDGFEVLRQLRADAQTADIPVLFLSARCDDADIERGLALGAADYLGKPVRPLLVLARVRTQLEAARERRRLRLHNRHLEVECLATETAMLLSRKAGMCALAHLAELRDPETGNHILRTQAYVREIAQQLRANPLHRARLDEHWIELLAESAPLHDIGKVGIPDHILLKPGPLTEAEFAVMRTHTTIGARAIEKAEHDVGGALDYFTVARQVALSHHERWDGRGYPQGLAGRAIPLAARIMAVADVFDALISARVYKRPLPVEEARRIILADAGTRFDPDVVQAFERGFGELVAIARRHRDDHTDLTAPAALPSEA